MWVLGIVLSMTQPVVHHELYPRRSEHVEVRNWHKLSSSEKLPADETRIGCVERGWFFAVGIGERHVASEPGVGPAHVRKGKVIAAAIRRAMLAFNASELRPPAELERPPYYRGSGVAY